MSPRWRADDPEGREGLEEEASAGALEPNEELEEAMREAAASLETRASGRGDTLRAAPAEGGGDGGGGGRGDDDPAALRAEVDTLRDRLLRLQADFENVRKRHLKEREESYQYGHQNLVKDLLPTVDNLERALEHARSEGARLEGLVEGVELVLRELAGVLGRHGVREIEADGQPFDPAVHEALAQAHAPDAPPNTVVQVVQKGFLLRERLLRPAKVLVSAPPAKG